MFDYRLLRGKIKAEGKTEAEVAKEIGMTAPSLSSRFNGIMEFRQSEIWRMCEILNIKPEEMAGYFFTAKVQKTEAAAN